jgi:hypothetical protein
MRNLYWIYSNTLGLDGAINEADRKKLIRQKVRNTLDGIMREYADQQGKTSWCEKSVNTIDGIAVVKHTYPEAKYLCLYRNCLDQVCSAHDTLDRDPTGRGYGFDPYLTQAKGNVLEGLVDYWCEKTSRILRFEQENPLISRRIKYESIVTETDDTLNSLFGFLGSTWEKSMQKSVFSTNRSTGPGDYKISGTDRISSTSVGRGQSLAIDNISDDRLGKINRLHQALGYQSVSR